MAYLLIRELGSERLQELAEIEITIGRSRHNQVKLLTEQSSRRHCKLIRTGNGYHLVDIRSANGTFVNGERVDEKELEDGDQIAVGSATIVFREGDPTPPPQVPEGHTSQIPIKDRSVQLVLQTLVSAASAQDLDAFLAAALDNVVEITQADRGILFTREGGGELKPRTARDRARRSISQPGGISLAIPQQVFSTGRAIYLLDTESQKEPLLEQSVSVYHLRTVMCAPLRVGDRTLGVLYVDSHAKTREYSATDLVLFESVANHLALAMENLRAGQDAKKRAEERRAALERENALLRGALEKRKHLIGECAGMKALYETVNKVAPTDATVLLLGESGTGKEAIAHVLHDLSPRSHKPFVVIDCAAIPETLLESELFGYEKGAFTGAGATKPGKMEVAHGGSLLLDEIAELTPALQVKLLRALEQKTLARVGGTDPIQVDVRLIAATNRNLEELVRQARFRQDLYFRLKVVTVTLPPLRDRGDDILLLADFFLAEANASNGRSAKGFTEDARAALNAHPWEGNIRELKHRIEQAVILSNNLYISTEDLYLTGEAGLYRTLEEARDLFEKSYIVKALARNSHNVTHTAKALGISRQHLQNLIKKYSITKFTDSQE